MVNAIQQRLMAGSAQEPDLGMDRRRRGGSERGLPIALLGERHRPRRCPHCLPLRGRSRAEKAQQEEKVDVNNDNNHDPFKRAFAVGGDGLWGRH